MKKKKYHIVGTVWKSNRKTVEKWVKIKNPNTHLHDHSLFLLGTSTKYALDINESFSFKRIKFELTDSSVEQYKILCFWFLCKLSWNKLSFLFFLSFFKKCNIVLTSIINIFQVEALQSDNDTAREEIASLKGWWHVNICIL